MKELLEKFRIYLLEKDSSLETIKAYISDVKKFIKWYVQTTGTCPDMRSVGLLDIAEFKRHLMDRNQKPSTINRAIASLSAFFKWLGAPNPAQEIKFLPE